MPQNRQSENTVQCNVSSSLDFLIVWTYATIVANPGLQVRMYRGKPVFFLVYFWGKTKTVEMN